MNVTRLLRPMTLGMAAILIAACGSAGTSPAASPSATPAASEVAAASPTPCPRFTAEEVTAVAGAAVLPAYDVPKCLKKPYRLAFINPGFSIPYFVVWSVSMKAAAKFYGVDFIENDLQLKFDQYVARYNELAIQDPDVIGGLFAKALIDPAKADGITLLSVGDPIPDYPLNWGASDEPVVGRLGGEFLGDAAKSKVDGDWSGRKLILVGLGQSDDGAIVKRIGGGLEGFASKLVLPADQIIEADTKGCGSEGARTVMTDILTAHPDDVFAILGCNDEAGIGALTALKTANRAADSILVTYGAADAGKDAMKADTTGSYIGAVDFNPYSQGWNWVAAAIALAEGETFKPFVEIANNKVVTPSDLP